MSPEQILKSLAKKHSFQLSERITDSRNVVCFAKKADGSRLVLKTHSELASKKYIVNELAFLQLDILKSAPFKVPKIFKFYEENDFLILETEFIEGENFKSFQKTEKFSNIAIPFLAKFCDWIESLKDLTNIRSHEKKEITDKEWNKVFFENLDRWKTEIISFSENETELIKLMYLLNETAQHFDMKSVGHGGIHGSSKMQEFIAKDSNIYVVDWETASSEYIRFYQTASIASYLLVRIQDERAFSEFVKARVNFLDAESKELFETYFKAILSQRIVGDIFDLVMIEKKEVPVRLIEKAMSVELWAVR